MKYLTRVSFTGRATTREPGSPLAAERTTTVEGTNMSTKADADLLIAAVRKIRETLP